MSDDTWPEEFEALLDAVEPVGGIDGIDGIDGLGAMTDDGGPLWDDEAVEVGFFMAATDDEPQDIDTLLTAPFEEATFAFLDANVTELLAEASDADLSFDAPVDATVLDSLGRMLWTRTQGGGDPPDTFRALEAAAQSDDDEARLAAEVALTVWLQLQEKD